jgi:tRNA dimethylallyltransferase
MMLPTPFHDALVLTGPTGSGKTQLGIEIAQRLDAEIISMDSMALYRGMDIGTAKPTPADRDQIPHHLIDVREPWESASVAWWLDEAKRIAPEIESRGRRVLFVGGTPLYLKALLCGLFDGPPADADLRRRLTEEARAAGSEALHHRLNAVDPASAARIHPNDVRRMIRALEVYQLTGKPMSVWQTQWGTDSRPQAVDSGASLPAVLWLDLPRDELYARIDRRVEEMFAAGLVDEVRRLRALDRPLSHEASQALGYKEIFDLLDGMITLKEAVVRVQTRSRNFAKRQIAWFRHMPGCQPATMELTRSLWGLTIHS